jgi:hypothetical protein
VGDDDGADLLVGEKLDAGVGEDAEEGGAVAAVEAEGTVLEVDIFDGGGGAEPGRSVF